jgi:hypothetical protein
MVLGYSSGTIAALAPPAQHNKYAVGAAASTMDALQSLLQQACFSHA